jgi:hypothetical protein
VLFFSLGLELDFLYYLDELRASEGQTKDSEAADFGLDNLLWFPVVELGSPRRLSQNCCLSYPASYRMEIWALTQRVEATGV